MKIFISYAHKDEDNVRELVDILTDFGYEPWFDHRLVVAREWQDQLLDAIHECDCFLYALTPDSFASEWCQWEFAQAVHAGKPVIPVLLKPTKLSGVLARIQYADFTDEVEARRQTARLLRGVQEAATIDPALVPLMDPPHDAEPERPIENDSAPRSLSDRFVDDAYDAFRTKNYDEARDLLHNGLEIDADHTEAQKLLTLVEQRLKQSQPQKEQETPHMELNELKIESLKPSLSSLVDFLSPPFEWVDIPAGRVEIKDHGWFDLTDFHIAKYPVTNAQFAKFIEAGGYDEKAWWTSVGWEMRVRNRITPSHWHDPKLKGAEYPVMGVSWYEALAFCRWLSAQIGAEVTLPTEQQWQRAAQGDDGREYPWGDEFDAAKCNTHESGIGQTTPVTRYPNGASPYGVLDMAGNVWEWCLNPYDDPHSVDAAGDARRVLRGGAWISNQVNARAAARYRLSPLGRGDLVGFRVLRPPSRS